MLELSWGEVQHAPYVTNSKEDQTMARSAASLERYWVDTQDSLPMGEASERLLSARIEAFPEGRILADSRRRPWAYDEGFLERLQEARETWLQATNQTEWDCSECGTWHLTPDAEFHDEIQCPRTPGFGPVMSEPEPPRFTRERLTVDEVPKPLGLADLPLPPENATPEEIRAWRTAAGLPTR